MSQKFVQTQAIALYTGMSSNATSCIVTPYPKDIQSGAQLTMDDFGDTPSFTIDPKIPNYEEICTFTGITDNGDGTATLTGLVRNLIGQSPYTTPGTGKQHGSSAVIVFSDNPQVYARLASQENDNIFSGDNHFTGNNTFDNFPITPATPNASSTVVGMSKLSVDPVSPTNPIALGVNDGRVPTAFATDAAGTDAYVITPSPAIGAYVDGLLVKFRAGTANTGGASINVNGLGVRNIVKNYNTSLTTGDILAGSIITLIYDSSQSAFQMQTPSTLVPSNPTVQIFTGSGTYTPAAGVKYAVVEVVGGGASGVGVSSGTGSGGGGGGGGGYARKVVSAAAIGASQTVTVGAGGVGVSNNVGHVGGTSSFGAIVSATGGALGSGNNGGIGGVGTAGDFLAHGGVGGWGTTTIGGQGGNSIFGSGGASIGGSTNGNTGLTYGGGGGGAHDSTTTAPSGGDGAAGIVIVTEHYI